MLNHFRTLLLNLSYDGNETEHIPVGYVSRPLQTPFAEIYKQLFPTGASRFYKLFLAHNYIEIVKAAGLEDDLKKIDPRISYQLDSSDFFKIYRYSNPVISSSNHPIFVYGQYTSNKVNDGFYDNFEITQVGSTNRVLIYSTINEYYINGSETFPTSESAAEITLTFTNGTSDPVKIGSTGITVVFGGGATFTSTGSKTWEFLVESPFTFNLNAVIDRLPPDLVDKLFRFAKDVDTSKYENLWKQHYNIVYRLAGLLLAYVSKLNSTL